MKAPGVERVRVIIRPTCGGRQPPSGQGAPQAGKMKQGVPRRRGPPPPVWLLWHYLLSRLRRRRAQGRAQRSLGQFY
eukprot:12908420-Prorocentrum_lima.AAC.1